MTDYQNNRFTTKAPPLPKAKTSMPIVDDVLNRPWLSNEAVARLPPIRNDFERNRDPSIKAQLNDLEKTEAQRRDEQTGRGSHMIRSDQPRNTLKPPRHIAAPIDASNFQGQWLKEQRNAAMERNARIPQQQSKPQPDYSQLTKSYTPPGR